jgi:UDPglucose 6-dehydrogenase
MSRVGVVGAGYVGLTTAACLAHMGHDVVCADIDVARIERLNRGEIPILEAGLPELVQEGLASHRLRFVVGAPAASSDREFVFLAVPTPQGDDGSADLSYAERAAREIAPVLANGAVVINKSTMPVGSTRRIQQVLEESGLGAREVRVASNPEFLREGTAVHDFLHPDRVVVGCTDGAAAARVAELYAGLEAPRLVTDPQSAEMIKYASNAFLAVKISFINAIANLCETVDADVREVALGMGYDHRIGFEFLKPGPGYGGSCFPKDTAALLHTAQLAGYDFTLLQGARDVNAAQYQRMVDKVRAAVGGELQGVRVAAWGLAFKANTDDLRDSPAIEVIQRLIAAGASVRGYDPSGAQRAEQIVPGLEVVTDRYDAVDGADVVVILTEWDEFRWADYAKVSDLVASPRIVDTRNLLDPMAMRRRGFQYEGVGR